MKHTRRIASLLLALVMVFAMATTAMAADHDSGKGGSATITVNSAEASNTYKIYKVFNAKSDGTSTNISYQLVSGKTTAPDGFSVDAAGNVSYNGSNTELTATDIEKIASYVNETDLVATVTTSVGETSFKVTGLEYGYYYITTTTGSLVTVDSTNPSATVNDKNTPPTIEKKVNGEDSVTAKIGEKVTYTVTVKAHKGATNYVFHDQMTAGLTLDTTTEPVVKVGETSLTQGTDYTLTKFQNETNDDVDDITITFTKTYLDSISADTDIVITYYATVNENAVIAGLGNPNTADLDYGDNNSVQEDTTTVYTYEFDIVKTDNSNPAKLLINAEFKLYSDASCTTEIPVVKVAANKYRLAKTDETGVSIVVENKDVVVISGLSNGTYYLKETVAPQGYNLLTSATEITINNASKKAATGEINATAGTFTPAEPATAVTQIVNQTGSELPSTGGMGTTLFYVVGGLMVLAAVVLLVTKKRMASAE